MGWRDFVRPHYHVLTYYLRRHLLAANREYKNLYKGQRCFVICTGASIRNMDLTVLKNEFVIGCNLFFQHPDFHALKVAAFFELEPWRRFRETTIPYYRGGDYHRDLVRVATQKSCPLFVSADNARAFAQSDVFAGANLRYIKCFQSLRTATNLRNDLAGKFTFMDGVVYAMIATAIYMGFEEIYLAGCDYTFQPRQSGHFYEDWTKLDQKPVDREHVRLREFADRAGVRIINIAPEGFSSPIYEFIRPSDLSRLVSRPRP